MMSKYYRFENKSYEMLKFGSKVIIKDKLNSKYYETSSSELRDITWFEHKSKLSSSFFCFFELTTIILFILNIYISFFVYIPLEENFDLNFLVLIVFYSFLNVIIHEFSHIFAFGFFERQYNEIGFKFNYIFPAFYVRMNDLYLLTKYEQIVVHSAGLFANLFLNSIMYFVVTYFFNNKYIKMVQLLGVGIVVNFTPILNSDGYKILLSLLNMSEKLNKRNNSIFIKFISIFNYMVCFMQIINLFLKR